MKAMLVYTASSCGVSASGIRLTAPKVPWIVSSSVRPVNTRMVSCFSWAVSVFQDGMSLDTGTFSGNQKLPVNRSHTSASFSSCRRFQLIAETRSTSFIPSDTRTPFRRRSRFADYEPDVAAGSGSELTRHYPWGATTVVTATSCVGVSRPGPKNLYSDALNLRVAIQYCHVIPLHSVRFTPCSSRYQLRQPPVFHTVPANSPCNSSL